MMKEERSELNEIRKMINTCLHARVDADGPEQQRFTFWHQAQKLLIIPKLHQYLIQFRKGDCVKQSFLSSSTRDAQVILFITFQICQDERRPSLPCWARLISRYDRCLPRVTNSNELPSYPWRAAWPKVFYIMPSRLRYSEEKRQ